MERGTTAVLSVEVVKTGDLGVGDLWRRQYGSAVTATILEVIDGTHDHVKIRYEELGREHWAFRHIGQPAERLVGFEGETEVNA